MISEVYKQKVITRDELVARIINNAALTKQNVDPYAESAIVKGASRYSYA
jgi:hypothetical protein